MENINEVINAIRDEYAKVFPASLTHVGQGFGMKHDDNAHCFTAYLGDKAAWYNGIEHNDPFRLAFWIHKPADANGKYVIECDGCSMMVECSADVSWTNRTYVKFGWRKKNQTPEKLIPAMKKFFEKMRIIYDENKSQMPNTETETYARF